VRDVLDAAPLQPEHVPAHKSPIEPRELGPSVPRQHTRESRQGKSRQVK
jgi:hypothetical protein